MEDWDFKGEKKSGIHSLGKYPATMVAPMQLKLLNEWTSGEEKVVLDPFMGSGTAIVEAQKLGFQTIGIDINPYAILLSSVKTHNYEGIEWSKIAQRLSQLLRKDDWQPEPRNFTGVHKWFRDDIRTSLTKVSEAIKSEDDLWVRRYLWVCMSEVIYSHSNDRTSTFKLHAKTSAQIDKIQDNVIDKFLQLVVEKSTSLLSTHLHTPKIVLGDSKVVCKKIPDESVDVICTSPPYGENATTVTYGQASILFLKWIDAEDLELNGGELENLSAIDSMSMGGKFANELDYDSPRLESFIQAVATSKQRKIRRFISDYWLVTRELARVVKRGGVVLYTVGNRRIDGVQQPLDAITIDMFQTLGFSLEARYHRNISSKRIPKLTSKVSDLGSVKSMDQESVLVLRKEN